MIIIFMFDVFLSACSARVKFAYFSFFFSSVSRRFLLALQKVENLIK